MMTRKITSPLLNNDVLLALIASLAHLGRARGSNSKPDIPVKLDSTEVACLRGAVMLLASVDPKAADTELNFLDAMFGNARSIGVAEAPLSLY